MAPKLNGLRAMTDEQVVEAHDGLAPNTDVGVNYYLDELTRREFVRASEAALTGARSAGCTTRPRAVDDDRIGIQWLLAVSSGFGGQVMIEWCGPGVAG